MTKKILIIGGSGRLSGTLAERLRGDHEVWALTRGNQPAKEGITPLKADRNNEEDFQNVILNTNVKWDMVFDCICMNKAHAAQDLAVLSKVTNRLVVISTDSVYDHTQKKTPQNEDGCFEEIKEDSDGFNYGANKRQMEEVFLEYFNSPAATPESIQVTLFRPGHIYGPGFLIGCYPNHSRQADLPEYMRSGQPLDLVAGGIYITQPIYVDDLVDTMIDCVDNTKTYNQIFCIGGPDAVENKIYYELMGEHLGVPVTINEIPLTGFLDSHPEFAGHLCHRIYDLSKLKETGVKMPGTSLKEGLKKHLTALGYSQTKDL